MLHSHRPLTDLKWLIRFYYFGHAVVSPGTLLPLQVIPSSRHLMIPRRSQIQLGETLIYVFQNNG